VLEKIIFGIKEMFLLRWRRSLTIGKEFKEHKI
jgi:hypothetical protein